MPGAAAGLAAGAAGAAGAAAAGAWAGAAAVAGGASVATAAGAASPATAAGAAAWPSPCWSEARLAPLALRMATDLALARAVRSDSPAAISRS